MSEHEADYSVLPKLSPDIPGSIFDMAVPGSDTDDLLLQETAPVETLPELVADNPISIKNLDVIPVSEDMDVSSELVANRFSAGEPLAGSGQLTGFLDGLAPAEGELWRSNSLGVTDYISDIGQELGAGLIEGVTLDHVAWGELGPDTTIGDIARVAGKIGGSVISYGSIAALLGQLGIASGVVSAANVALRAGLTGFIGTGISADKPGETALEKLERAAVSGVIGAGVSMIPFIADKAIIAIKGGDAAYMGGIKAKLGQTLADRMKFAPDKVRTVLEQFDDAVVQAGGSRALRLSAKAAVKRATVQATSFRRVQNSVHGKAFGKQGLKLDKDTYRKLNLQITGEASTKNMDITQLNALNAYYGNMLKQQKVFGIDPLDITPDLTQNYNNYDPGSLSRFISPSRYFHRAGLDKVYDRVYDANTNMLTELKGFDIVRKQLARRITKKQSKAIFDMMNISEIPADASDEVILKSYASAARDFGVDADGVFTAAWIRRTSNNLLKRANVYLKSIGKPEIKERAAYITNILEDTTGAHGRVTPEVASVLRNAKGGQRFFSGFLKARVESANKKLISDPLKVHSAYVKSMLKTIHLSPARDFGKATMNSQYMAVDGKLVKKELPADMFSYFDDWMDYNVMGYALPLDKAISKTLGVSSQKAVANIKLASYMGTIWGNPASVVKNMTQQSLNFAELGTKYWLKGIGSFNPKSKFFEDMNGWQFADKYSSLLKTRLPGMEGMGASDMNAWVRLGMTPFRLVDKANITAGFNGAFKMRIAQGKSFNESVRLADKLVNNTQYNYANIDLPLAWMSSPGKLMSQFQSWWLKYSELLWSWGGDMPLGDGSSRIINVSKNVLNAVKSKQMARYLGFNTMLLYGLHEAGIGTGLVTRAVPMPGVSAGPFPTSLPPAVSGLLAIGKSAMGTIAGDSFLKAEGLYDLEKSLQTVIPGGSVIRKINRIKNRKADLKDIFVPKGNKDIEAWLTRNL